LSEQLFIKKKKGKKAVLSLNESTTVTKVTIKKRGGREGKREENACACTIGYEGRGGMGCSKLLRADSLLKKRGGKNAFERDIP